MARKRKRKSSGGDASVPQTCCSPGRINIGIERADNGNVVHLSSEGIGKKGGYESKTLIAPDNDAAIKIATSHIESMAPKLKKKKDKSKTNKKIISKR